MQVAFSKFNRLFVVENCTKKAYIWKITTKVTSPHKNHGLVLGLELPLLYTYIGLENNTKKIYLNYGNNNLYVPFKIKVRICSCTDFVRHEKEPTKSTPWGTPESWLFSQKWGVCLLGHVCLIHWIRYLFSDFVCLLGQFLVTLTFLHFCTVHTKVCGSVYIYIYIYI